MKRILVLTNALIKAANNHHRILEFIVLCLSLTFMASHHGCSAPRTVQTNSTPNQPYTITAIYEQHANITTNRQVLTVTVSGGYFQK